MNGQNYKAASGHLIGSRRTLGAPLYLCLRTLSRRRTRGVSFQSVYDCAVHLPESFRGGCSFGAGTRPVSPAAMRTRTVVSSALSRKYLSDYGRIVTRFCAEGGNLAIEAQDAAGADRPGNPSRTTERSWAISKPMVVTCMSKAP